MAKRFNETRIENAYHQHSFQFNALLLGLLATAVFLALLYIITDWQLYLSWIVACSLTTMAMFGIDKALSKTDHSRIPESILHLFTLLGGFPGQLAGRFLFRHKTNFHRHPSFNIVFIVSLVLYGVLAYLLFFS